MLRVDKIILALTASTLLFAAAGHAELQSVPAWTTQTAREEISPHFEILPRGGVPGLPDFNIPHEAFQIVAGDNPGSDGAWVQLFPVVGGEAHRFRVWRKTSNVASPRRSALAKITWLNAEGKFVNGPNGDTSRPEYPLDQEVDEEGWTQLAGTYEVPEAATQAKIELRLRWAPGGSVLWSAPRIDMIGKPKPRTVRLASIHFRPRHAKTALESCEMFAPYVADAAKQGANLVCLPESITYCGFADNFLDVAEPIPGPSTKYFGKLAKEHGLYIVAGLTEKAGELMHNTAVLLAPDGSLVGKYRKVCLPREEIEAGITPGTEYPVFDTSFGRLGMMICWDVTFPEVARNLSNNGAEVIAMPIWDGDQTLAKARAIENQIYLVSSTYATEPDMMISGVINRRGKIIARTQELGSVTVAEVDLGAQTLWPWLGDLRSRIPRERPLEADEK